jgi:4-hydroxy-4-methyl-2-oxoglutarate aldolase
MITINPRHETLSTEIIETYKTLSPATLGHILETAMESYIQAVWKPIKLVGPAVTVQTYPQMTGAIVAAKEIAKPGDVLVINRADDRRHAYVGEISCLRYMEARIGGVVTDGPACDQAAISHMKFPVFSRGTVAMTGKAGGFGKEWGGVNVPVIVGGVMVHPGDMIFGDDDGVLVVSPEKAGEHLAFVQEKEEWEAWVRVKIDQGWTISQCYAERPDPMSKVTTQL